MKFYLGEYTWEICTGLVALCSVSLIIGNIIFIFSLISVISFETYEHLLKLSTYTLILSVIVGFFCETIMEKIKWSNEKGQYELII